MPYQEPHEIVPGVTLVTYLDAGHILGSAISSDRLSRKWPSAPAGLHGRPRSPQHHLLPDPTPVQNVDVLVSESTYGNRELDSYDRLIKQLHAIGPGNAAPEQDRDPRIQPRAYPAHGLLSSEALTASIRSGQFRSTSTARWPLADRDPSRLPRRLHPLRPRPDGQGSGLLRLKVRRVLRPSRDDSRQLNHLSGPMVIISSAVHVRGRSDPSSLAARRLRPRQRDCDRELPGRGERSWPRAAQTASSAFKSSTSGTT